MCPEEAVRFRIGAVRRGCIRKSCREAGPCDFSISPIISIFVTIRRKSMLGFGAFRRKPRQFEYRPLHYDPVQEAREQRRKELLGEDAESPLEGEHREYKPGQYIRGGIRRRSISHHEEASRRKMMRSVAALVMLVAIVIWIIVTA